MTKERAMLSKERLAQLRHQAEKGARMEIPASRDMLDLIAEIERLEAACREKDERNTELDAEINDLSLQLSNRAEDIEVQAKRIAELEAEFNHEFDERSKLLIKVRELEATVERLTKSLFKAGEQLDTKEAENQKMAELLDQAPHAILCLFETHGGQCDCWKKEANALLSGADTH